MYQPLDENISELDMLYIIMQYYQNEYNVFDLNKSNVGINYGQFDHTKNLGHTLLIDWRYLGIKGLHLPRFDVDPKNTYRTRIKIDKVHRYIRKNRLSKLLYS
jgi:hypothetical protein